MDLNLKIDHTCLKPNASFADIESLCQEAIQFNFYSVCINSYYVPKARKILEGTSVKICTVVGFPLGASNLETKRFEAMKSVTNGANEIDMVVNISAIKSQDWDYVEEDISSLAKIVHQQGALLKVILETALLSDDEKRKVCEISQRAGVDFVKTSTGFASSGASVSDVQLMKESAPRLGIKASGGIKNLETALQMIQAGATRLGTSSSVQIMKEFLNSP